MEYLNSKNEIDAKKYMKLAIDVAMYSSCLRSKCGAVIVKDDEVIGKGFNSPPGNIKIGKCIKDDLPKDFKSDKTCCVHAEQRAIMDALKNNPEKIIGSRLYFIRLDDKEDVIFAGDPYCTICSKMTLDSGIKEFVLWHKQGICVYDTEEYNKISFEYHEK